MNRIELIGRLTTDIELKFTSSGMAMSKATLAVDRPLTKEKKEQDRKEHKQTADFPRILMMGKTAENASKYLKKGALIAVEGSVKTSTYENAEGQKIYATEIFCDRVHFLEQGKRASNDASTEEMIASEFEIEEICN